MRGKINNLPKRLTEVNEILNHLSKEDFEKIPKDITDTIRDNMDKTYIFKLDETKKIYEQDLEKDTVKIIAYINYTYLVNEEQKAFLKRVLESNNA